jgi:tetratricopeptide (TPR) repeat protein
VRVLLFLVAATLWAQSPQPSIDELYTDGDYAAVITATDTPSLSAASLFLRGMAFGRLERWEEAHESLSAGQSLAPTDPRFPTELAGVAYRLDRHHAARQALRRALQLAPNDEYSRNFLGTLHLLDDNLDAALFQWNHLDKPRLSTIETPPTLHTRADLLDRALAFAPTETLALEELHTSRARLDLLDAFATYNFDLVPDGTGGDYKLRMRAFERRGWSSSPLLTVASLVRGLPYQTVFLDYANPRGNASSLHALARWDPNRRRANFCYSRPLAGEARHRWSIFADARNERWGLAPFREPAPLTGFQLQKVEAGAGVSSVVNGALQWSGETAVNVRSYRGAATDSPRTPDATGVRTALRFHWTPLRLPARRITFSTDSRIGLGSVSGDSGGTYGRLEGAGQLDWTSGHNWTAQSRLSAGALPGTAPFDELYILGVERDNLLEFRGIRGALDGHKGSAPVGDRFWLSSSDITRRLGRISFLDVHAGPFFDVGTVSDHRSEFGSGRVQLAAGIQLELRVLGIFGVKLLYGRDLRNGSDIFFSRPTPDKTLRR